MSEPKPRVHGLGGVFFKADDPAALAAWYQRHLGLVRSRRRVLGRRWHRDD